MSLWSRIAGALSALAAGEGLFVVFDYLRGTKTAPPEKSVAFTIAIIALSAKMAKADGVVTRDEVTTFRKIFTIPPEEEANAARVFNLARQDVAGFDVYAQKIAAMFKDSTPICTETGNILIDILEGLFHISMADGTFHPTEEVFLKRVAEIFGLSNHCFNTLKARMIKGQSYDPYEVLGLSSNATISEVRKAWRQAVKESHPDAMMSRGVPLEAIKLAEARLVALNAAWEEISRRHAA